MLPGITSIRAGSACWTGSWPRAWRCSRKRSNKRTGGDIATSSCAIVSFNRAREPNHPDLAEIGWLRDLQGRSNVRWLVEHLTPEADARLDLSIGDLVTVE